MIGIIGAMEAEVAILKDTMEIEEIVEYAGMNFCRGKLNGRRGCCCKKRNRQSECGCLCAGARR